MWSKRDTCVEHEPFKCGINGLHDTGFYQIKHVCLRIHIVHWLMRICHRTGDVNLKNKSTLEVMKNSSGRLLLDCPLKKSF